MLREKDHDIEMLQAAWRISFENDVVLEKNIASGTFGAVWLGTYKNVAAAIKMIQDQDCDNEDDKSEFRDSEIEFLMRTRHDRLAQFYGCGRREKDGAVFIVLEFAEGGSLDRWTWGAPMGGLPWSLRLTFMRDTAEALRYLHEDHASVHRDLKSPNILVVRDNKRTCWRAKVSDFGMSKIVHKCDVAPSRSLEASKTGNEDTNTFETHSSNGSFWASQMDAYVGTPSWMAPELLVGRSGRALYGPPVDIYSFGICCYEQLVLRMPWKNVLNVPTLFENVREGKRPPIEDGLVVPAGFRELFEDCWHADPNRRPNAANILVRLDRIRKRHKSSRTQDEAQILRVARAVVHFDPLRKNVDHIHQALKSGTLKKLFVDADKDGSGSLSYQEFRDLFSNEKRKQEIFRGASSKPSPAHGDIELSSVKVVRDIARTGPHEADVNEI